MPLGMRGLFATWASPDRCPVSAHVSYMVRFVKPMVPAAGDLCAARTHAVTLSPEADIRPVAVMPALALSLLIALVLAMIEGRRLLLPG